MKEEVIDDGLIKNHEKDRLPSNISLQDFAKAMRQLDLGPIPKEKRYAAVIEHLMRIMENEINDRSLAKEIKYSRILNSMEGS